VRILEREYADDVALTTKTQPRTASDETRDADRDGE
jgi:hypothetical protein